jgi:hypothetical protein
MKQVLSLQMRAKPPGNWMTTVAKARMCGLLIDFMEAPRTSPRKHVPYPLPPNRTLVIDQPLSTNPVAVAMRGKYIKMPLERIGTLDHETEEWKVVPSPDDPAEVTV